MADYAFVERRQSYAPLADRPNWRAIWAGVFGFFAIWTIFEVLAMAIFTNPVVGNGINAGLIIWDIVLSIVAMFVAGRITSYFAGAVDMRDALTHATTMFGLTVVGILVLLSLGAAALALPALAGGTRIAHLFTPFADFGWVGFFSLLLGWLAALGGASMSIRRSVSATPVQEARRAA